jgi:hypothetical protein
MKAAITCVELCREIGNSGPLSPLVPMKSIFIAAAIAATCSGVALADDLKQDQQAAAPAVKAQVMSDSEMDRVTAGDSVNAAFWGCPPSGCALHGPFPSLQTRAGSISAPVAAQAISNGFQGHP